MALSTADLHKLCEDLKAIQPTDRRTRQWRHWLDVVIAIRNSLRPRQYAYFNREMDIQGLQPTRRAA